MKTVFSNYNKPITSRNLHDLWMDLFKSSDELLMATGYISNDALEELTAILQQNPDHIKKLELLVGMHYLEGFTRPQYESLTKLAEFLNQSNRGQVYVSTRIKFHGKLYAFRQPARTDCLIGSANLGCFWDKSDRTYETMFHIDDQKLAEIFCAETRHIIDEWGEPVSEAEKPSDFKEHNFQLDNHLGVCRVSQQAVNDLFRQQSAYRFYLRAKCEPKSSLNVFFGKGREDKRGFVMPRPWYEAELIVSKKITTQEGYPQNRSFDVVTDDGWRFGCNTSGDYAKNFRSANDLKILGKWIKGRLEANDCLKTGETVTEEVLHRYGNNEIELRSTDDENLWLLSFRGKING